MRALADLLADEGVPPPAWNLPTSIKMMVPVEKWRHALVSHGHINDDRRRFSELKNKLKRKNLVAERDSKNLRPIEYRVWPPATPCWPT